MEQEKEKRLKQEKKPANISITPRCVTVPPPPAKCATW